MCHDFVRGARFIKWIESVLKPYTIILTIYRWQICPPINKIVWAQVFLPIVDLLTRTYKFLSPTGGTFASHSKCFAQSQFYFSWRTQKHRQKGKNAFSLMPNQPSPTQHNLSIFPQTGTRAFLPFFYSFIHPHEIWMDYACDHRPGAPKDDDARKCWDLPNFCLNIREKSCWHSDVWVCRQWEQKRACDVKGVSRSTKSQLLEWLCCVLHGDNFPHLPVGALILLLDRLLTAVGIEYLFYRRDTLQFHHHSIHHIGWAHREASRAL